MPDKASHTYYRQLCQHLGVAVVATDLDLNIRTWNVAAARTFGAAAERMIGTPAVQIVPQDRRDAAEGMLRRAIETGETIQFEFQHRDAQGEGRELAATIAPVVSESGERVGASVCIRDITRRIALQNELNESRKMIALGEMAGAIAHHFNNILGGIVTSIDYANANDDPAVWSRVLRQAGTSLQRATTLVEGLGAFAEGDRHAGDMGDLTEIVAGVAEELGGDLERRGIDFKLDMPKLPSMRVVKAPVTTILRNITRNALDAMPDSGSLTIDVSSRERSIVILVADTGCGLDEEAKSRIFEPFWSTKGVVTSGPSKGVGLGLAVAHGLIHMLGGTISVTSRLGKGSCFRITLPLPDDV